MSICSIRSRWTSHFPDMVMYCRNKGEMKKKVLIDLSSLKHLNCGLGQVAMNYALYYQAHADSLDFETHLLVPKRFVGAFGKSVMYHNCQSPLSKLLLKFTPIDLWHTVHQLSRFYPGLLVKRNLLTVHDLNFVYEKTAEKQKKYFRRLQRKINRADRVVCISNFAKEDLLRHMNVEKPVDVLYNGVEYMSAAAEVKPRLPGAESGFLFSIGQMFPKKNFHVLLDAMKLMPEYTLYLAGSRNTEYASMIEKRINDEQIGNVFLLGEIRHEEKIWLYNHCEAFVFPSLFEGFGLPVIEALSFGKPVVSSSCTSLKEIGGSHVFFLEGFEPEQIAAAVREAVRAYRDNPALAESGRRYALSFSYEKHMAAYVAIFNEMLEK